MKNRIIYISFLLLGMFLFHSCDVTHTNPLDPDNPDSNVKYIIGKTFLHNPLIEMASLLPGTKVYFEKEGVPVYSDDEGNFAIACKNPVNQKLFFEHSKFFSDSVAVNWPGDRILKQNCLLYRKPEFDSILYYSSVLMESDLSEKTELFLKLVPVQGDRGLVDSINLVNDELNINFNLNKAAATNFEYHISKDYLKLKDFDAVLGQKFSVKVYTVNEKQFILRDIQFIRFMNTMSQGSPSNSESVFSDTVYFKWPRLNVSYRVSYGIMIYRDGDSTNASFSDLNIKAGVTEYKYVFSTDDITKKILWRLVAIDDFGNRIISGKFAFIYKPVVLR